MTILPIARMGHPTLATPARPVDDPTGPETRRMIADMIETMRAAGGVGLAAPQVHVPLRVIVYEVPAERNDGEAIPLRALLNPVLEPVGDEMAEAREACLSLPGLSGRVPRHTRVRWRALDAEGQPTAGEAVGFHARVLQHECDHLDGILYPMRMPDLSTFAFDDALRDDTLEKPTAPEKPTD
jgi:peptide deformylase